jgi:hypothetical protein
MIGINSEKKFKVKCIKELTNFFSINKEYDASYHPTRMDYYFIQDNTGVRSYKPTHYFELVDIEEAKEIEEFEYWNSIKKVVCITNEYKGSKYNGGVIIGEVYDVVEYVPISHPNGRFRIEGKLEEQRIMSDFYPKELFITLEQFREQQLNKIGIDIWK